MWGLPAHSPVWGKGNSASAPAKTVTYLGQCFNSRRCQNPRNAEDSHYVIYVCFLNPEPTCDFTRARRATLLIDVLGQSLGNTTAVHRLHSRNKEKNKWGIGLLKFAFMQRFHRGRTVCRVKPRPRSQPHFFLPIPPLQNDPSIFFPEATMTRVG